MNYEALSALIIEESATRRSYLWQATLSEPQFAKVKGVKSLEEAIRQLTESKRFDVILLSNSFSRSTLAKFITQAKESAGGKESAFILVLPDDDQTREKIALTMKDGMDGFLFTPFSVSSLKEVARIASNVKQKFETAKRKASLLILLPEISHNLDLIALAKTKNKSSPDKEKELERLSTNLKEIALGFRDIYLDILSEICEKAPPREIPLYKGASERVKALINKKKKSN
jgi:DNA-binding NarL/FixJ family response regulator